MIRDVFLHFLLTNNLIYEKNLKPMAFTGLILLNAFNHLIGLLTGVNYLLLKISVF